MSSLNSEFCLLFSNLDFSFLFSCFIAVYMTSNTMLNKSGKCGYPYIVTDLRGNSFYFSPSTFHH